LTTDVLALPEVRYQFEARQFSWPFSSPLQRLGNLETAFFAKNNVVEELGSVV